MFLTKLTVILAYFIGVGFGQNRLEVKLIKDFLDNQNEPNVITSLLCWNKVDLVGLQMIFSELNYLSIIHRMSFKNFMVPHKDGNLFLMDLRCGNSEYLLQKANDLRLFTISSKWLIFTDQTDPNYFNTIFTQTDNLIESRVIIVQKNSEQTISLNYAYKITKNSSVILQEFGDWNPEKGFLDYKNFPVVSSRRNLMRTKLKTSLIYTVPDSLNHLDDYRFGTVDTQLKLNYKLINYVFDFMNASMELMWDRTWGEHIGNNTYSGLLGRIHRKEVDIGASPLFCIKERLHFYDCIAMTTPAKSFFLFRKPPLSYVANIFTLPFETNLWLSDIAFLVICTILLYLAVTWEWKVLNAENERPQTDMLSDNIWDTFMFTIGAVCQQGYPDEPKSASGRIILLTLCLTMIFMFTAFSANTVVLFQSSASNIKTLEDLYNSKMPLGVDDMLYYKIWFARTFEPFRRQIYLERIVPKGEKPRFYPLKEGIARLRRQYFAFHTDVVTGYQVISDTFEDHEKCGLQQIDFLQVSDPWVTTPKYSPYRELYYIGYKLLSERGLIRRDIKKLYPQIPECNSKGSNFRSAGILDLYSVYMLFFIGVSASSGLLILELIAKKLIEPRLMRYMVKRVMRKMALKNKRFDSATLRKF